MQKSTPIYCTSINPSKQILIYLFHYHSKQIRTNENFKKHQISFTLDAILAIYNTPMNIYHCFVFGLINRVCEVLRQRISKRYSKRHFLYVCQSHPCTKQTARHGISKSKYMNYFLFIQNFH